MMLFTSEFTSLAREANGLVGGRKRAADEHVPRALRLPPVNFFAATLGAAPSTLNPTIVQHVTKSCEDAHDFQRREEMRGSCECAQLGNLFEGRTIL